MKATDISEDKNMPLVSVCCLAYNHEKTVADAIEGILSQKTDFKFELIIHDDASTDKTADIIRGYAEKYPEIIKPIFQQKNQYYNCNLAKEYLFPAVAESSSYIAICEGDDYWTDRNKLSLQVKAMEENKNRTMCFHAVNQLDLNGKMTVIRPLKCDTAVDAETVIKRGGMFCPSVSLLIRRDIADLWTPFRISADVYDYPVQVLAAVSGEVYYLDKIMGVYRFCSDNSWTARNNGKENLKHTENEVNWLKEFSEYTGGKYDYSVNYHLAHLWFCEYRKAFCKKAKEECKKYKNRLKSGDRLMFSLALSGFTLFGKTANKMLYLVKRLLLK